MKILGLDILDLKTSLKNTVLIRVLVLPCINLVREEERGRRMYSRLGVYISAIYTFILLKHGKKLTQILIRHMCKTKDTHIPACTMFVKRLTGRVPYSYMSGFIECYLPLLGFTNCYHAQSLCRFVRAWGLPLAEKKKVSRS